jgi:hypothetical protein
MVGGKFVVRNHHPTGLNYECLRADVAEAMDRLQVKMDAKKPMVANLEPLVSKFCVGLSSTQLPINRYIGP